MTLLAYSARAVRIRSPGPKVSRRRPCPRPGSRSRRRRSRRPAADQPGDRGVGVLDLVGRGRRRLVAADLRLAAQVGDDGVGDLGGRQRGTGVVEVGDPGGARGVPARPLDIEPSVCPGNAAGACGGARCVQCHAGSFTVSPSDQAHGSPCSVDHAHAGRSIAPSGCSGHPRMAGLRHSVPLNNRSRWTCSPTPWTGARSPDPARRRRPQTPEDGRRDMHKDAHKEAQRPEAVLSGFLFHRKQPLTCGFFGRADRI